MAVYERNYGRYQGELTPSWSRFLILPRYAAKDVFDSRLFVAFFALCFLLPFVGLLIDLPAAQPGGAPAPPSPLEQLDAQRCRSTPRSSAAGSSSRAGSAS